MWAKRQLVRSSRPQKAFVTLMTPCSHCVAKVGGSVRKGLSLVTRKTPCHAMSVGVLRCGKGGERCGRREIRCNTAATKVKQVDGGMVWICRAKGGCRQSKKPGRPGGTGKQLLGGGGSAPPPTPLLLRCTKLWGKAVPLQTIHTPSFLLLLLHTCSVRISCSVHT